MTEVCPRCNDTGSYTVVRDTPIWTLAGYFKIDNRTCNCAVAQRQIVTYKALLKQFLMKRFVDQEIGITRSF